MSTVSDYQPCGYGCTPEGLAEMVKDGWKRCTHSVLIVIGDKQSSLRKPVGRTAEWREGDPMPESSSERATRIGQEQAELRDALKAVDVGELTAHAKTAREGKFVEPSGGRIVGTPETGFTSHFTDDQREAVVSEAREGKLQYPRMLPPRLFIDWSHERRRTTRQILRDGDGNMVAAIETYNDSTDIVDFLVIAYRERMDSMLGRGES